MEALISPFNLKTVILAKHAQHVVLIHFPIALYISAVLFRFLARRTGSVTMAEAAYYNLSGSAVCLFPVLITGVLAWQLQLEGQKLHGPLLLHVLSACASTGMIWVVWWIHYRVRKHKTPLPGRFFVIEIVGVVAITLTAHLGGFVSGVNGSG